MAWVCRFNFLDLPEKLKFIQEEIPFGEDIDQFMEVKHHVSKNQIAQNGC